MRLRVENSKRYAIALICLFLGFASAVAKHFLPGLSVEIVIAVLSFAGSYVGFESWRSTGAARPNGKAGNDGLQKGGE